MISRVSEQATVQMNLQQLERLWVICWGDVRPWPPGLVVTSWSLAVTWKTRMLTCPLKSTMLTNCHILIYCIYTYTYMIYDNIWQYTYVFNYIPTSWHIVGWCWCWCSGDFPCVMFPAGIPLRVIARIPTIKHYEKAWWSHIKHSISSWFYGYSTILKIWLTLINNHYPTISY